MLHELYQSYIFINLYSQLVNDGQAPLNLTYHFILLKGHIFNVRLLLYTLVFFPKLSL